MPIERAIFYSTSNREDEENIVTKYTIEGQHLGFIVKRDMDWRTFYQYIQSVAKIDEIDVVPE